MVHDWKISTRISYELFLRSDFGDAILQPDERKKDNLAPDAFFYDYPRLCFHADAAWHASLTDLYYEYLPEDSDNFRMLDMMSSWVSHLPTNRYPVKTNTIMRIIRAFSPSDHLPY